MEDHEERSMVFSCLVKEETGVWIGHCLELDIVTTAASANQVQSDLTDLIVAQVSYAFSNDNVGNLYQSAPADVWKEYYACKILLKDRISLQSAHKDDDILKVFVPPWIIKNTCFLSEEPYV